MIWGGGEDVRIVDRTTGWAATSFRASDEDELDGEALDDDEATPDLDRVLADVRRVMPMPTARERRLELRLRAAELIGLIEAADPSQPETEAARVGFAASLADTARAAAMRADEARAQGLDPLTLRSVALDSGAGANLLRIAGLPPRFSYSSLSTYEACPLQFAFKYVYRMPEPAAAAPWLTFGSTAHAAFEAFTKARREAVARGEAPPTREDLEREFRSRWVPTAYGDREAEERYGKRVATLLDNFWEGELASLGEAIHEELDFELRLDPGEGGHHGEGSPASPETDPSALIDRRDGGC